MLVESVTNKLTAKEYLISSKRVEERSPSILIPKLNWEGIGARMLQVINDED
jgi:hypothetical protein